MVCAMALWLAGTLGRGVAFQADEEAPRPPASIGALPPRCVSCIAGPPRTTSCSAASSPSSPSSCSPGRSTRRAQDSEPGRGSGARAAESAGQRRGRRPRPLHARPGRGRGGRGARTAARRTRGARGPRHRGLLRSEAALRARRIRRPPLPADRRPRAADPGRVRGPEVHRRARRAALRATRRGAARRLATEARQPVSLGRVGAGQDAPARVDRGAPLRRRAPRRFQRAQSTSRPRPRRWRSKSTAGRPTPSARCRSRD